MQFSLEKSLEILDRTPQTLQLFIKGLDTAWVSNNEGGDTWSVYDVIGHLIHGEKTDWIIRTNIILSDKPNKTFEPFDRFAQFAEKKQQPLDELLNEFASLRQENLAVLRSKNINAADLNKRGVHPALGEVSLAQLLATWVVHDLNHLAQIARIMAKQYKNEVGPWIEYLRILKS